MSSLNHFHFYASGTTLSIFLKSEKKILTFLKALPCKCQKLPYYTMEYVMDSDIKVTSKVMINIHDELMLYPCHIHDIFITPIYYLECNLCHQNAKFVEWNTKYNVAFDLLTLTKTSRG